MDFNLKQWDNNTNTNNNNNNEFEDNKSYFAKIPRKMFNDSPNKNVGELPLFVSQSHHNKYNSGDHSSTSTLSVTPTSISKFAIGGRSSFSMAQWHELEVQAVIYRHIVAGSAVPPELLHLIHKSLLTSPYYLHHYPTPSFMQAGYWGKGAMDPEPGRCRRTDGKKWRCSRDVVGGYKYCERHMHRGRNRSRKPVECPTSAATTTTTDAAATAGVSIDAVLTRGSAGGGSQFSLSGTGASSFDAFQLHSRSEELRSDKNTLFDTRDDSTSGDGKSNNTVLMDFFDNGPRSLDKSTRDETNGYLSSTRLSMSTPGNSTSDFLRLSTGNGDEAGPSDGHENEERERGQISWTGGWGGNTVASMGGPLAEALRSSSNSSPTSVLHQLPRCSAPDTSFVSV